MCIKRYNDKFLYIWYYMPMEDYIPMEDWEIMYNEVVGERRDGSSDGLPEALDIDMDDGYYKECSNWNPDLHKKWTLEALYPEIQEPTADQLVEAFNKTKQELFPGKEELTPKEEREVYEKMEKNREI